MRRLRTTAALLVVTVVPLVTGLLLGPGCAGAKDKAALPTDSDGGRVDGPIVEVPRLELSRELAGRAVVEADEGPWRMRRTNSGADGTVEKLAATSRMGLAAGATSGGAAPGSPPATGAALPDSRASDDPAPPALEGAADGKPAPARTAAKAKESRPSDSSGDDKDGGELLTEVDVEELDRSKADAFDAPADSTSTSEAKRARRSPANDGVRNLRAGSTDDNVDFDAFLAFLTEWPQKDVMRAGYQPLDVRDRRYLRVVDATGRPVPGAVIGVTDVARDKLVATATTYGDGRAPFYPHLDLPASATGDESMTVPSEGYLVEARYGDERVRVSWSANEDELTLTLGSTVALADPFELDVMFLIDTTGSMGDEIASIKASLLKVTEQLRSMEREFQLRYGAVLFRDIGDEYVTATHPFTSDIEAFDRALASVKAQGGGDGPESVNQGLAQSIGGVEWREGAAKVVFLIGDAPPHMDYAGDTWYGASVRAAVGKGIRVHSVAASGLDGRGTLVWRQIAQFTRGKFIFIEYGSTAKSAASHGVTGAVKSNNLEDILFEQIRDELARFGR